MDEPPPDAIPVGQPVRRAELKVHHHGHRTYRVHGGATPHWVWYDGSRATCDCADFIWRDSVCKHIQAVHHETRDTNSDPDITTPDSAVPNLPNPEGKR